MQVAFATCTMQYLQEDIEMHAASSIKFSMTRSVENVQTDPGKFINCSRWVHLVLISSAFCLNQN